MTNFRHCSTRAFQSTPSVGRATHLSKMSIEDIAISIHALRGEGDEESGNYGCFEAISIHALRGEGDHTRHSML